MKVVATVLMSTLACVDIATESEAQQVTCIVADPTGTPLNIRDAPDSPKLVGTLQNGTAITVERFEDYRGRWWAQIKNLGWVYKNYLNCTTDLEATGRKSPMNIDPMFRTGEDSAVSDTRWLDCSIAEETPPQAPDVLKISIEIITGEGGNGRFANYATDMGVVHHARSGTYNRAEQYVNTYLLSDADNSYIWTGSPRSDKTKIMEGHLKAVNKQNIDGRWLYTEELMERDNRIVVYRMRSSCRVTWKHEYGDFDEQGNEISKPVAPAE